jgi:hypothetical protein
VSGEQDDIMVICAMWSRKNMRQTPGSVMKRCASCRRRLTVSPVGQRVQPDEGFAKRYLCIRCAQAEAPDETAMPAPGSLEAAAQVIGKENAIIAGAAMRRVPLKDFKPEEIDGK